VFVALEGGDGSGKSGALAHLGAVLGEGVGVGSAAEGFERDAIMRIETNIDDLSPEIVGAVEAAL